MRRFVPVCFALVALTMSAAKGDEARKTATIKEYFRLAKLDQLLTQSFTQISNQMKSAAFQQMLGMKLTPEQQRMSDELQDRVLKVVKETLSWKDLEPTYVKLYSQAFSESEMDAIVAFYRSPAGQTMVGKTPQIMEDANRVVQQRMVLMQPKIQEILREFTDKLKPGAPEKQ